MWAYEKDDALNEPESVAEHQSFHLRVVAASPV